VCLLSPTAHACAARKFKNAFMPQAFAHTLEDADFIGSPLSLASAGQLHRDSVCHAYGVAPEQRTTT